MSNKNNLRTGNIYLAVSIIFFMIFIFLKATKIIRPDFYEVFYYIILAVCGVFLIMNIAERSKATQKIFFFDEKNESPLSKNTALKYAIGLGFGILFALLPSLIGSQVIDIPQPFIQESFAVVSSPVQFWLKLFLQSIIPGFFEEAAVFILVSALKFILLLFLMKRTKKPSVAFVLAVLIASAVGASALTVGHIYVYGSDSSAYMGIWTFEFFVQLANMFTGTFISWIPHMTHNAVVTFLAFSLVVFGGDKLILATLFKKIKGDES